MAFSVRNVLFLAILAAMMLVTVQAGQCYRQCLKEGLPNCERECRDDACYRRCRKEGLDDRYCSRNCLL
ncbi:hypothetical protein BGW42_007415 [Actinomortierella wolfii]|nr:hypothetical protein BGW42_007415 [Actinomortierella wolfii]KAG0240439.1 hypothetical protein BGW41_006960 [Actinomortierella wolfii]